MNPSMTVVKPIIYIGILQSFLNSKVLFRCSIQNQWEIEFKNSLKTIVFLSKVQEKNKIFLRDKDTDH